MDLLNRSGSEKSQEEDQEISLEEITEELDNLEKKSYKIRKTKEYNKQIIEEEKSSYVSKRHYGNETPEKDNKNEKLVNNKNQFNKYNKFYVFIIYLFIIVGIFIKRN